MYPEEDFISDGDLPSITEDTPSPGLTPELNEQKSLRYDFALGEDSPGPVKLLKTVSSGDEERLRQDTANQEDAALNRERLDLLRMIADQSGGNLSPDDLAIVQHIATTVTKTDPDYILEKRFGDKVVDTVTQDKKDQLDAEFQYVKTQASESIADTEWFKRKHFELLSQWDQKGLLYKAIDYGEHFLTGIPAWIRLREALSQRPGVEFLMGSTLRANVQYLWSLPSDQRRAEFSRAVDYLVNKHSLLDAMTLSQAMVSYPSSEEAAANFMTFGDYAMVGGGVIKAISRARESNLLAKALSTPERQAIGETPTVTDLVKRVPTEYYKDASLLKNPRVPPTERQLELFPTQEQGQFRFIGQTSEQTVPPGLADKVTPNGTIRNPRTGRFLRATTRTDTYAGAEGPFGIPKNTPPVEVTPTGQFRDNLGRFNRSTEAMRQSAFDFGPQPPHQGDIFRGGPSGAGPSGGTPEYKYLNTPKTKPFVDLQPSTPLDPTKDTRVSLAEAVKASADMTATPEKVLSAAGDINRAGMAGFIRRVSNDALPGLADLKNLLPSFAAPGTFFRNAQYMGRELAQRLEVGAQAEAGDLFKTLSTTRRTPRLTTEQLQIGLRQAQLYLEREYGTRATFSDHVLDTYHIPAEANRLANVDAMVMRLGESKATGFTSAERAENFRKNVFKLSDQEAFVTRQGDSFFIDIPRNVNEADDLVRAAVWSPQSQKPQGMIASSLSWLRSADYLVPAFQRKTRKLSQHALQNVRLAVKDLEDKTFFAMSKNERRELFTFLENQRDIGREVGAVDPSKRRWFASAGEFEQAWIDRFQKPPTPNQTKGYDTYARVMDFDYLLRNAAMYRDFARLGVENFRVPGTSWFLGKKLDSLPWHVGMKGEHDAGIYLLDGEKSRFFYKFDVNEDLRKHIDGLIKAEGYSVLQVAAPAKHPLKGVAKTAAGTPLSDEVHYILTKEYDKGALPHKLVDYDPGPHVIYPHKWYLAVPVVREGRKGKLTYFGDNVALNLTSEAEGREWASKYNVFRRLLQQGRKDEAFAYAEGNLPHDRKGLEQLFLHNNSPFDLSHDITVREAGYTTVETNPTLKKMVSDGRLVDATKNPHDLSSQMDKSFTQERDMILQTPQGLRLTNAEQLDPYASLHRALNQSLRNLYMNDYKTSALDSFWTRWGHMMRPPLETLRSYPGFFLFNPQWESVASNQWPALASAKAELRAIASFVGSQSELGGAIKAYETKVQNLFYKVAGSELAGKLDTSNGLLSAVRNPFDFMRQLAFHSRLGLFNPAQYLVQASQMNHAIAIAGVRDGVSGISGAWFLRAALINPQHIDHIASMAGKFGWKPAEFKALAKFMDETGISKVGGETVFRDQLDPPLIRSALGHLMVDIGPAFFNEGERMGRLTGLATAFKQFVRKNGIESVRNLSDRDAATILDRADLISGNMTRASAAAWQHGVFAPATQFFSWNARMVEQLLGKQLSGAEKARVTLAYGVMYGVPTAASMWAGGWPFYDGIKKAAMERGIDIHSGWFEAATDGMYSYLLHLATGKDYNLVQRTAPGNNQALADIVSGDTSLPGLIFGASGSILADTFKAMTPFYYYLSSVFSGNDTEFKVTPSHFVNALRTMAKTADNATLALGVWNYGKWITKTGTVVSDKVDAWDGVAAALGFSPLSEVSETYLRTNLNKSETKIYQSYESDAFKEVRQALQALAAGDYERAALHSTNARAIMELGAIPFERRRNVFNRASKEFNTLAEQSKWDLFWRAPVNRRQDRLEQLWKEKE